jgi:proliferating cell nuclear antigen PCNA
MSCPVIDIDKSKYLVYVVTTQGSAIRTITETLKECLQDTLIRFDEKGTVSIKHLCETNNNLIVSLLLNNFDYFHCRKNTVIGLDMTLLHKFLKSIVNGDVLTLYIETEEEDKELGIKIENTSHESVSFTQMNLKDLDITMLGLPGMKFDHTYDISCPKLQKSLRDLSLMDKNLHIYIGNKNGNEEDGGSLILHTEGRIGKHTVPIITKTDIDQEDIKNLDNFTKIGMYNLEDLNLFFKATSVCSNVNLYLRKDDNLLLKFNINNFGTLDFIMQRLYEPLS